MDVFRIYDSQERIGVPRSVWHLSRHVLNALREPWAWLWPVGQVGHYHPGLASVAIGL